MDATNQTVVNMSFVPPHERAPHLKSVIPLISYHTYVTGLLRPCSPATIFYADYPPAYLTF